jgi:hypothetical protein
MLIRSGRKTVIQACLNSFRSVFRLFDWNKSFAGQHRAVIEAWA